MTWCRKFRAVLGGLSPETKYSVQFYSEAKYAQKNELENKSVWGGNVLLMFLFARVILKNIA